MSVNVRVTVVAGWSQHITVIISEIDVTIGRGEIKGGGGPVREGEMGDQSDVYLSLCVCECIYIYMYVCACEW